jgi:hypothetical protein
MTTEQKSRHTNSLLDCYSKAWNPVFSTERRFFEPDYPLGQVVRDADDRIEDDNVTIFLRGADDSPASETEELLEFLRHAPPNDNRKAASRSWLNESSTSPKCCSNIFCSGIPQDGGQARNHKPSYTATELTLRLGVPVRYTFCSVRICSLFVYARAPNYHPLTGD